MGLVGEEPLGLVFGEELLPQQALGQLPGVEGILAAEALGPDLLELAVALADGALELFGRLLDLLAGIGDGGIAGDESLFGGAVVAPTRCARPGPEYLRCERAPGLPGT